MNGYPLFTMWRTSCLVAFAVGGGSFPREPVAVDACLVLVKAHVGPHGGYICYEQEGLPMQRYVRFETQLENVRTNRPLGIFQSCDFSWQLCDHTRDRLHELLGWFNQNLAVPALKESD